MLLTIYIVSLIVGGGLLLISTIFSGSSGHDAALDTGGALDGGSGGHFDGAGSIGDGHGGSAHGGHDMHPAAGRGHGLSLGTWFSFQFLVYFLAAFGLVGTTLHYGGAMSITGVLGTAVAAGLVIGQGAHHVIRLLKRTSRGSEVSADDFLHKLGRVTVAIAPPRQGEIVISLHSGERYVNATAARGDDSFRVGEQVVVTAFRNGVAEVISKKEHEFVSGN